MLYCLCTDNTNNVLAKFHLISFLLHHLILLVYRYQKECADKVYLTIFTARTVAAGKVSKTCLRPLTVQTVYVYSSAVSRRERKGCRHWTDLVVKSRAGLTIATGATTELQVQCCFTSTETVRSIRNGPRQKVAPQYLCSDKNGDKHVGYFLSVTLRGTVVDPLTSVSASIV